MINKLRHYFLRRKALKLFADRFLFEPSQIAPLNPSPAPQTTFAPAQPQSEVPQTSNAPPVSPAPLQPPTNQPIVPPVFVTPKEEIVNTLTPLVDNRAKMEVINRRLNS